MEHLIEFGLLLAGFALHALGKAREIDRATPERESFLAVLGSATWGDDDRWRTLTVLGLIALLGLTGSTALALATLGISVTETGGKVLLYCGAGYGMESIAPKLLALVSRKAKAE